MQMYMCREPKSKNFKSKMFHSTLVLSIFQKKFKMYKCMELIFDCLNTVLTLGSKLLNLDFCLNTTTWTLYFKSETFSTYPGMDHTQKDLCHILLSCFQKSIRYWNFRIAWGCLTCVIFFTFWSPWLFSHALLPDFGDGLINLHLSSLKHFFWRFSRWKENLLCVSRLMIQIGSSTGTEGSSE